MSVPRILTRTGLGRLWSALTPESARCPQTGPRCGGKGRPGLTEPRASHAGKPGAAHAGPASSRNQGLTEDRGTVPSPLSNRETRPLTRSPRPSHTLCLRRSCVRGEQGSGNGLQEPGRERLIKLTRDSRSRTTVTSVMKKKKKVFEGELKKIIWGDHPLIRWVSSRQICFYLIENWSVPEEQASDWQI